MHGHISKSFCLLIGLAIVVGNSSCKLLLRYQARKKPAYDLIDKQIASVSQSLTNLSTIEDLDFCMKVKADFIRSQFNQAITVLNHESWPIPFVASLAVVKTDSAIQFENELVKFSPRITITTKDIEKLNSLTVDFTTRIPVSASNDTLIIRPNFDEFTIVKINGKQVRKNYRNKKGIIKTMLGAVLDELNRRFLNDPFAIPINFHIYEQQNISDIFQSSANQKIISTSAVTLNMYLKKFAPHIDKSGIYVVADLEDKPIQYSTKKRLGIQVPDNVYIVSNLANYTLLHQTGLRAMDRSKRDFGISAEFSKTRKKIPLIYNGEVIPLTSAIMSENVQGIEDIILQRVQQHIDEENAKRKRLNDLLDQYAKDYRALWNVYFDSPADKGLWAEIKKSFVSTLFNTAMTGVNFDVNASLSISGLHYEKNDIRIGKIDINNNCADYLRKPCSRRNCDLWGCCGCKWYRPDCCTCEGLRAVARAGCLALDAAEVAVCHAGHVAEFTWCETKIIGANILNEMAKVGNVAVDINAAGNMTLRYKSLKLSQNLDEVTLESGIGGSGNAHIHLDYEPKGLVGFLACPIPFVLGHYVTDKDFNIGAPSQPFNLTGGIDVVNASNSVSIKVKTSPEDIFLVVSPPPVLGLIADPDFVLNCTLGAFGIALGTFGCAFFGDEDLQKYAIAGLTGLYNYEFQPMEFTFDVHPLTIESTKYSTNIDLNPSWRDKGLAFETP